MSENNSEEADGAGFTHLSKAVGGPIFIFRRENDPRVGVRCDVSIACSLLGS